MRNKTGIDIEHFQEVFKAKEKELESKFFEFLRFPSISADPLFHPELQACADWIKDFLETLGFEVELWNRKTAPIVFAQFCQAGKHKPTVLIYNHYDVQPVDPIDLWESQPFTPRRDGNTIYARGAQDNKGQCFYVLAALKALIDEYGTLPVNVKLCIEGEEESGSAGLQQLLHEKKESLAADYLLVVDLGMPDQHTPAITLGTRGLVSLTCEVQGTRTDLHSGSHGGIAYNPLHALVEILSSLRNEKGQITIPGFYESVIFPTKEELQSVSITFDPENYFEEFGQEPTGGEKSFSVLERLYFRPTLELNGISGGYNGPGTKTVIPAKAQAKISCRLVPNQDPHLIGNLVKHYLENIAPKGVTVTCTIEEGVGSPVRTLQNSEIVRCLAEACEKVYWKPCEFIYEGASIPITANLAKVSNAQVAMFGLGLPTDQIHAPNEHFSWDRIEKGFLIIAKTLDLLGLPH